MSELDPTLVRADDYNVTLNRWTEYGHDRLYVNGFETEPYIDLDDMTLHDTGMVKIEMTRDGDTITLSRRGKDRDVVIALSDDDNADEVGTEQADEDTDGDDAPASERFDVGDRVENPSQRPGTEYEVVDVREVKTFGGTQEELVVERVDGRGTPDEIPEREHDNWQHVNAEES